LGRREPAIAAQAEEIVALVRGLRRDLLRNPAEDAESAGLTGPQVSVMACLVSKGPTTLTEVSRTLGMNHSTASGIVDRLQARGLVRRTQDPDDQRRTRLVVTDKVTRYVQDLQAGPSGRLAVALAKATPAERDAIRRGLRLLSSLLRARVGRQGSAETGPRTP
jgi:DNA-binding MarR family transcriptional regulator